MQTGMAMAAMIIDKHNQFSYAKTCLQAFLLECGRSEGILQSDSEEYLIALVRATAKACGNMAVRFSPAYSSQSNGNVERYHRTLTGQIRTLRELVQQNYNIQIPTDHPLMAWAVRLSILDQPVSHHGTQAIKHDVDVHTMQPYVNLEKL